MASDLHTLNDPLFSPPIDFDSSILENPFDETNNYANLPSFAVKTEDSQFYLSSVFGDQPFDGSEILSNNCSFNFKPTCFDTLTDFRCEICENRYSNFGQITRVCSTGDLQSMKTIETRLQKWWSPLDAESSHIEEANIKVGRYTAGERKQRILRYKAKRTQRNFNKTIKYACRKTLADNRTRVRGRFARNNEPGEMSRTAASSSYEEENDLWIDGCNVEEEEGILFNILQPSQFKYCGC